MHLTPATRWLLGVLAVDALIVWTVVELTTSDDGLVALVMPMVVTLGLTWWQTYRTPEMRREREVTARALIDHRDPGPRYRAAVEALARERAAGSRALSWLPTAVLLAAGGAGAVVAVLRDEAGAAPPLVGLVLAAFGLHTWIRRRQLAAARWLDDPPHEEDQA